VLILSFSIPKWVKYYTILMHPKVFFLGLVVTECHISTPREAGPLAHDAVSQKKSIFFARK
jgi:hypothetical protein